ncbi:hypothetical protein Avbf_13707 [Armadillidium vulgare]|nr:hypothetical protein Avbf_13707 [Armadillidium vulgare]
MRHGNQQPFCAIFSLGIPVNRISVLCFEYFASFLDGEILINCLELNLLQYQNFYRLTIFILSLANDHDAHACAVTGQLQECGSCHYWGILFICYYLSLQIGTPPPSFIHPPNIQNHQWSTNSALNNYKTSLFPNINKTIKINLRS